MGDLTVAIEFEVSQSGGVVSFRVVQVSCSGGCVCHVWADVREMGVHVEGETVMIELVDLIRTRGYVPVGGE
jgi:hypothetical protein